MEGNDLDGAGTACRSRIRTRSSGHGAEEGPVEAEYCEMLRGLGMVRLVGAFYTPA